MKKNLCLLLVFLMTFFPNIVFASNADTVTVNAIADKTEVTPGDTLTVTLKVKNLVVDGSQSSKGMQLRFDYDSTKLAYESKSNGSVLSQANTKNVNTKTAGQIGVVAVYSDSINVANGDLVTLKFTVKDGATGAIDFAFQNATGEIATTFGSVPQVSVAGPVLPTLAVTADKDRVLREEEVTYSFDLSKVTDLEGIEFDFDYDETKLEFISSYDGEIFDDAMSGGINDADGMVKVIVVYDDVYEFEGNICTLTFKVKTTAANGAIVNEVKDIKTTSEIADTVEVDSVEIYGENLSAMLSMTADKTEASRGEEIEYSFDLSATAALEGIQFDFDYDETRLEFVSFVKGEIFDDAFAGDIIDVDGKVGVVVAYDEAIDYEGNICKITLKVKEDAPAGDAAAVISELKSEPVITVATEEISVNLKSQATLVVTPNKEGVTRGSEVTYSFDMTEVMDFHGIEFDFDYDETKLEFVSAQLGEVFEDALVADANDIDGVVKVIGAYDAEAQAEGNVCTITFVVKDTAEAGEIGAQVTGLSSVTDFSVDYASVTYVPDQSTVSVVADKDQANTGDFITYTVNLSETLMYRGMQFTLDYDETQLTYVGYNDGDAFADALVGDVIDVDGTVMVVTANQAPVDFVGGSVCELVFEVNSPEEGAVYGETTVSFTEIKAEFDVVENLDEAVVNIGSLLNITADKEEAVSGDDVVYSVDIAPACEFIGMEFFFEYDAETFEFIENIPGEAFEADGSLGGMELFEDGKIKLILAHEGVFEGNICKIVFRVKEDVPYGVVYNSITELKAPCVLAMGNTFGALTIVPSAEDIAAAEAVSALIEEIGDVTLDSSDAIVTAENAYEALTDNQKTLVTNTDALVAARETFDTIVSGTGSMDNILDCGTDANGIDWIVYNSGVLKIDGVGAMEDYLLKKNIPWYSYKTEITEILIGEGITHIGSNSFNNYVLTEKVMVPSSVTSIGTKAFYNCTSVKIYAETGSYAEIYARDNGIPFVKVPCVELRKLTYDSFETDTRWYFDVVVEDYFQDGIVYAVSYTMDGKILTIGSETLDSNDWTTVFLEKSFDVAYIKLFVWKPDLTPVTETVIVR